MPIRPHRRQDSPRLWQYRLFRKVLLWRTIEYRKARRHQASADIAGASVHSCSWPRPSTTWTGASLASWAPTLQYKVFHWTDMDYANINIAFKLAYAIGLISMGAFIDRMGTKIGFAISFILWSLFSLLHAAVRPAFSVLGFVRLASAWASVKRATFLLPSRRSASGFPRRSVPSPRASSMPGPTWEPSSRP